MTLYIDSGNFSTATTVYLDSLLTEVAPDGYYSNTVYFRQQIDGKLIDVASCPDIPCRNVLIGDQIWTSCNLGVETYSDGTPIPEVSSPFEWADLTTGAWCYYFDESSNGTIYGKLYNWYAVAGIYDVESLYDPLLRKKLAPDGYHVPSITEVNTMVTYLGGTNIAGGKLKESGTTHWNAPNTGATNSTKFNLLPGGYRNDFDGNFGWINESAILWTTSQDIDTEQPIVYRAIYNAAYISTTMYNMQYGFSVRLIRD